MLRATPVQLAKGQFQERLKTRLVGYIPKVIPRKLKGALVHMRSEANTGSFPGYLKNDRERLENTGKKLQQVHIDPVLGRYTVHKESKVKTASILKSHIQKPLKPL